MCDVFRVKLSGGSVVKCAWYNGSLYACRGDLLKAAGYKPYHSGSTEYFPAGLPGKLRSNKAQHIYITKCGKVKHYSGGPSLAFFNVASNKLPTDSRARRMTNLLSIIREITTAYQSNKVSDSALAVHAAPDEYVNEGSYTGLKILRDAERQYDATYKALKQAEAEVKRLRKEREELLSSVKHLKELMGISAGSARDAAKQYVTIINTLENLRKDINRISENSTLAPSAL